jgi:hypothetical protein
MENICQHLMDLAENSTAAGAGLIEIRIAEDEPADLLTIEIKDDGAGMAAEAVCEVNGPLTDCKVCGMGLTLFSRACQEAGGKMEAHSAPESGTLLRGTMRLSHEDGLPLGDVDETLITLIMGSPGVDWVLRREKVRADGTRAELCLDTRVFRAEVGSVPLSHPEVIRQIRASLRRQEAQL